MAFALLSANFPNAKIDAKLESPTQEQLAAQIANFSHVISSNLYSYAPLDYEKIQGLAPKTTDLKQTLSCFTPTKIAQLVAPTITLKLVEPSDESQLKKHKQKVKALEEISIAAFLHALFEQVYPQKFTQTGNPQKTEVRLASNLPEWQVVKKVDVAKAEPKEVLMALSSMYNSLHVKYPSLCQTPLTQSEAGRKSYSNLLQALSTLTTGSDFASEWKAFETLSSCGFPPIPSTVTIGELYPEIKIPKPRGNFGKKKKK